MKSCATLSIMLSSVVMIISIVIGFLSTSKGNLFIGNLLEKVPIQYRDMVEKVLGSLLDSSPTSGKTILLYMNGEHTDDLEVKLDESKGSVDNLGSFLSPFLNCKVTVDATDIPAGTPCRVFNSIGVEVTESKDVNDGEMLFLVPPDRHFVWPTIEVGRRVVVPHVINKKGNAVEIETLSLSPRVYMLYNFFDEDEADTAISEALSITQEEFKLKRSSTGTKGKTIAKTRTSENAFVTASENSMTLKKRIFSLLGMKFVDTWADGLQLLRYNVSLAYNDHLDYLEEIPGADHSFDSGHLGTNRFATVVLYLNNVEAGGETVFSYGGDSKLINPKESVQMMRANKTHSDLVDAAGIKPGSWEERLAAECVNRLAVKPVKGSAVLFYNQHPDGKKDEFSRHGACPVLIGQKWAANLWVWNGPRYGYTEINEHGRTVEREDVRGGPFPVKLAARNEDVKGATLYYNDEPFRPWPAGKTIAINSYTTHIWKAVVDEMVVKTWKIHERQSEQTILLWSGNLDDPIPITVKPPSQEENGDDISIQQENDDDTSIETESEENLTVE